MLMNWIQKKFCGVTPIIRDLLETGFETFHANLDVVLESKLCCESGNFQNDKNSDEHLSEEPTETLDDKLLGNPRNLSVQALKTFF